MLQPGNRLQVGLTDSKTAARKAAVLYVPAAFDIMWIAFREVAGNWPNIERMDRYVGDRIAKIIAGGLILAAVSLPHGGCKHKKDEGGKGKEATRGCCAFLPGIKACPARSTATSASAAQRMPNSPAIPPGAPGFYTRSSCAFDGGVSLT